MLFKRLATCLLWRIGRKINSKIPVTKVAYRASQGTTEQLLALNIMAEKAVKSSNIETHILMIDISRAFDTANRKILLEDLRSILEPRELHIIKVLMKDVRLMVDVAGKENLL